MTLGPLPVRWRAGDLAISANETVDLSVLEVRVNGLVKKHRRLRGENAVLRGTLAKRDQRVRELEEQIRELNQRRQDAGKRLGELIARLGRLDAQLESGRAAAARRGAAKA